MTTYHYLEYMAGDGYPPRLVHEFRRSPSFIAYRCGSCEWIFYRQDRQGD